MATKATGKRKPRKGVATAARATVGRVGSKPTRSDHLRKRDDHDDVRPTARPRKISPAHIADGRYGDGEVWGFVFIAGPTGSGKSCEANRLVAGARRCVKFIPANVTFEQDGWPVFSQPGELVKFLAARTGSKQARCIYHPAELTDPEEHFELVCRIVRRAGNLIFYVDEVDQFCSANGMMAQRSPYWNRPENKHRRPAFADILDSGRHAGLALVTISRVPAQVNRKVTANAQEMRIFRQSEPNVLSYFADKGGKSLADMLPTLGDYEYVLWQDGKVPAVAGGRR